MTATVPDSKSSSGPWFMVAIIGVLVIGAGLVAVMATGRERLLDSDPTADVEISGESLLPMPDGISVTSPENDPNSLTVAPTLKGTGFDDTELTIEPDGRAKVIYFLAHWCPHCQVEVPLVQDMIDRGLVPEEVDIYAVSTDYQESRGNPPQVWLDNEGFTPPIIRDDDRNSALAAFGGGGFPYVIYLNADHQVVSRSSGSLNEQQIQTLWSLAGFVPEEDAE